MPVGLLLILDQAHIQDVLTGVVNSRLQFQITQVHYQHVRGQLKAGQQFAGGGPGQGPGGFGSGQRGGPRPGNMGVGPSSSVALGAEGPE